MDNTRLAAGTAERCLAMRAVGARERDPAVRCNDDLAERLLPLAPRLNALARVPGARRAVPALAERIQPGAYGYEIARLNAMDAIVEAELAAGAGQLLVLGAGFDTRVHRLSLDGVRAFEADHPATAAGKRERVRRVFGALPASVTYVDVDLAHDAWPAALATAGYDIRRRSVIVWSGVSMYLDADAVGRVLAFAGRHARGSALAFDYRWQDAAPGLAERLERMGEPLRFALPRGELPTLLATHGLNLSAELGPAELERRHLRDGDGRVRARPYGCFAIATARVE